MEELRVHVVDPREAHRTTKLRFLIFGWLFIIAGVGGIILMALGIGRDPLATGIDPFEKIALIFFFGMGAVSLLIHKYFL